MEQDERRYLVHIRLGGDSATIDRIKSTAPEIKSILDQISAGNCQFAYASHDGATFGFLVESRMPATAILIRLESPDKSKPADLTRTISGSPLINDDQLMVLEIGDDFSSRGMGRAGTWLQHH